MAYDLEEQEQLASLKAWWNQFGNIITWVVIAALAAYAGWTYFETNKKSDAARASALYEELNKAVQAKDVAKVTRAASDLQSQFAQTSYAQMGGLVAAKAAFEANDLKGAKAQLQWVISHTKEGDVQALAKLRLAGVLLDEKAYDEGLKILAGEFPAQFAAMVADRKGDILTAQNKLADARTAYQSALEKTDEKNPMRQIIQIKLESIGGSVPVKAAA